MTQKLTLSAECVNNFEVYWRKNYSGNCKTKACLLKLNVMNTVLDR